MEKWFTEGLIAWYNQNKRDLPWRHEKDPYKIWLSEVILQQTQVAQGLAYYLRFVTKYPDVGSLAAAPEDEVLKLWQGLGYYSRARNLLAAARSIVSEHKGVFPASYEEIRRLKGVGDYTAAAIASFAFDMPYAVVDGNVYRLLSRIFGIESPVDTGAGKNEFRQLASNLLDKKKPAIYNQAIMEFGSRHCRPMSPPCASCVFAGRCAAKREGSTDRLPLKSKKVKIRNRHLNYLLLVDRKKKVLLNRRNGKDIWNGLYEFTLIESQKEEQPHQLLASDRLKKLCGSEIGIKYVSGTYKHLLTHQRLFARFYVIELQNVMHSRLKITSGLSELDKFAFPKLIDKFLADCDLKEIV